MELQIPPRATQTHENDYSRGIKKLKCLAPATSQRPTSNLILVVIVVGMEEKFQKTPTFRSFQISMEVWTRRKMVPFVM